MKKKLFTLVAAILCVLGVGIFGNDGSVSAVASVECRMYNTSLDQCFLKIKTLDNYSTLQNACKNATSGFAECKNRLKNYLSCEGYSYTGTWCDIKKDEYAGTLYEYLIGARTTGSSGTSASCTMYNTKAEKCYKTLRDKDSNFSSIKSACTSAGGLDACKASLASHLDCTNIGTNESSACQNKKSTYSEEIYQYLTGAKKADDETDDDSGGSGDDDDGDTESKKSIETVTEGECATILSAWCHKDSDEGIREIIRFIINILTGAIVVAGTVGLIVCGILWMTARENESQVVTAKKRMLDIVIGVVAWILIYALANLFIPKTETELEEGNFDAIVTEIKK